LRLGILQSIKLEGARAKDRTKVQKPGIARVGLALSRLDKICLKASLNVLPVLRKIRVWQGGSSSRVDR
jgi:hypothetical protein